MVPHFYSEVRRYASSPAGVIIHPTIITNVTSPLFCRDFAVLLFTSRNVLKFLNVFLDNNASKNFFCAGEILLLTCPPNPDINNFSIYHRVNHTIRPKVIIDVAKHPPGCSVPHPGEAFEIFSTIPFVAVIAARTATNGADVLHIAFTLPFILSSVRQIQFIN